MEQQEILTLLQQVAEGSVTPQQAEAEINRLLSSGQMSQQEFEYLKGAAKQFITFLK